MNNIPCIIVNRDRLTSTQKLCYDLIALGYTNIHILDMESTYQPLIDWYKCIGTAIKVHYLSNVGQQALWKGTIMKQFSDYPFVVYSDSDVELNPNTPKGFIEQMILIAQDFRINKVGLGIEINDLPDNELCNFIKGIESNYWNPNRRLQYGDLELYDSPIDTTFCVVRTNLPFSYQAVRIGGAYTCRHVPWYEQWDNLTEEQQYFMDHADPQFSTLKQHYLKWKAGRAITI